MRWEGNRESSNVEDVRSGGGGGGGFGIGGGAIGIGTIVVALIGGAVLGINPLTLLGMMSGGGPAPQVQTQPGPQAAPSDEMGRFVSTVLADTEDVWKQLFTQGGATYQEPRLVLFRGAVRTACGTGQSAMGPFYCPGDQKVYIDLGFFDTLRQRLGAPGDFAQAYVIAHEVGHHVQNLLGITGKVDAMRGKVSEAQMNQMSVRIELQADCLAGVWAHDSQQGKGWLEQGDLEEAMNAASRIGDDTLQKQSGGTVVPETFTHGTSAQRVAWFRRGLAAGNMNDCNTFDTRNL
ncbi:MAG: neutral zinc metallopeptidase [Ramlibacter sp.]